MGFPLESFTGSFQNLQLLLVPCVILELFISQRNFSSVSFSNSMASLFNSTTALYSDFSADFFLNLLPVFLSFYSFISRVSHRLLLPNPSLAFSSNYLLYFFLWITSVFFLQFTINFYQTHWFSLFSNESSTSPSSSVYKVSFWTLGVFLNSLTAAFLKS